MKINCKLKGEKTLYLFRALNDEDEQNITNNSGIMASQASSKQILSELGPHVAKASKMNQKDCWISTCKTLDVNILEYAIPQGGKYNTAANRKNIAVIDVSFWKNVTSIDDCYTVFKQGNNVVVDFSTLQINSNYGKKVSDNTFSQVQYIRNLIDSQYLGKIDSALFDCSFPRKKNVPINKLDFMSFSKKRINSNNEITRFGLFDTGITAVQNGIARDAKEVLCLNCIPNTAIKTILTPIQQDVLYMIKDEVVRDRILNEIISGNIGINWNNNNIEVWVGDCLNKIIINGQPWMYPSMIYQSLSNSSTNIETDYDNFLNTKECLLKQAIDFILNNLGINNISIGYIPERDGLCVFDFDANNYNDFSITKRKLYDVVAIKWEGQLHLVHNTGGNVGIIGKIDKANVLIDDLIKNRKIQCPELEK